LTLKGDELVAAVPVEKAVLQRGLTGSSSHTQANQLFDSANGAISVVVVAALAWAPLTVDVDTAQRVPAEHTGGTVPSVEVEKPAVGVALVLQRIIKYGALFASVARPIQDTWFPELVGVEVEDWNSSRPSSPTFQTGGVLRTVKVVVAVPWAAATRCNSVEPMFTIKTKANNNTPVKAVKMVILPAVSTYRGNSCLLYDIYCYLSILADRIKVMH